MGIKPNCYGEPLSSSCSLVSEVCPEANAAEGDEVVFEEFATAPTCLAKKRKKGYDRHTVRACAQHSCGDMHDACKARQTCRMAPGFTGSSQAHATKARASPTPADATR